METIANLVIFLQSAGVENWKTSWKELGYLSERLKEKRK